MGAPQEEENLMETTNEEPYHDSVFEAFEAAKEPLYDGCPEGISHLYLSSRTLKVKSDYNMVEACVDELAQTFKVVLPTPNKAPASYYETKNLTKALGLPVYKIDVCEDNCMLFWKGEDRELLRCRFCDKDRYHPHNGKGKKRAKQRMFYMPIKDRLKRLYQLEATAKAMRWHAEHMSPEGEMHHPSDGAAWKHFNEIYPNFAAESRNIYLGLSTDGFNHVDNIKSRMDLATWQSNFMGPWKNWSNVPEDRQETWWHTFVQHYYWETRFHDTIYSLWRKETMTSTGDRISKKKTKKKKPKYIGQTDWDFLMEYWDTTPAQKKSKSAANSRMSDPLNKGIHKHCAGPVPFVRIEYDMTHIRKAGTFIDPRSESLVLEVEEAAKQVMEEDDSLNGLSQTASSGVVHSRHILNKEYLKLATTRIALNAIMKSLGVTIIPPELVALARDAGLGVHGSAGGRDGSPAPIVSPAPTTSPAVSLAVSRAASPTVPSTRTQQSPLDAWCASLGI
ncbi:Transposon En/Spm-like [Arabidopsis thaliana x Arabidopsis arenosa]|nr:Transposon En/Spm-like [Arabidopsis thaliana x Arabidopsis arenosa]